MTNCEFVETPEGMECVNCHAKLAFKTQEPIFAACENPIDKMAKEKHLRGPGTELHAAILRWTGETITATCACERMIRKMNRWGPAGCRERLPFIVARVRQEARRRNWVLRFGVAVPGAKFFIRQLVLNAIDAAERNFGENEK